MAVDEAMVRAVTAGLVPPTLRLYAWEPPSLSLGRGQPIVEVDLEACTHDGVDVVRRPTGGRAILHTDELTYSVVAPLNEPRLEGDIVTSYRRLSRALLAALEHLSVVVESRHRADGTPDRSDSAPGNNPPNPVCFEVPSHYELTTADGRKIVGSAQMRTQDAVLQHGTLPLAGDIARICRYLVDAPDLARVRARAATVEQALGCSISWKEAADAMVQGFGSALNLQLPSGSLMAEEQAWACELRQEKYGNSIWTRRV
jgi:lipoate-protein ligase A